MNVKVLMLVILVLLSGTVVSVPVGKGCIIKYVFYDDLPVEGALVELCPDGSRTGCVSGYTDASGSVSFCEQVYGSYLLNVDWDDDGVWDTVAEPVLLDDDVVEVYNYYYPPEVGCGDNYLIVCI